ncbi:unnamed protein product, partial [Callosobruchus maculatus]
NLAVVKSLETSDIKDLTPALGDRKTFISHVNNPKDTQNDKKVVQVSRTSPTWSSACWWTSRRVVRGEDNVYPGAGESRRIQKLRPAAFSAAALRQL